MRIRKFHWVILIFISLLSCKKKEELRKEPVSAAPEYGDFSEVDFSKIFSERDRQMPDRQAKVAELQDYYKSVWEAGDLWGGILVAKADDVLLEEYRGHRYGPNTEPIDAETPMHIASVSKPMTAVVALKLVETGKLSLEDKVTKFFPEFPYPEVTVFTLLSQRSGLPKYEYFIEKLKPVPEELSKKFLTNRDILNLLIRYQPPLARPTGTGFMYCNTNYTMLALIIEKITKKPFPEAMQIMLFQPLKMSRSFIFMGKDSATATPSFYPKGPKQFALDRLDLVYGDKNVYSTPRDLLRFSQAMFSEKFLRKDLMDRIFQPYSTEKPGVNNYGLGFRMKIFDNGEKLTYHNGWWHGSNAVFAHLPKSKATIVAIGNKYSRRVYSALAISSMFEDFPPEADRLRKELHANPQQADSAEVYSE
ncbi:beta-lactamase family protein [Cruoricaptor ignavus]|uniref:Beta-lactamase family protein n=1 Tax=Cruoricaptor ignavus TaxID=1118202 RepID=A0A7M1SZM6_9FLAO|nr:serine hydrolase domain-containing protein [Cruoricaptor ignavus]QOR73036.1 beta-lactamase family protein [Cruoricaptor ignavus]